MMKSDKGKKLSLEKNQKLSHKEFKKLCGQIRRSNKYISWKKKVLRRDNLKVKFPNVHHKKSFKSILINNNIKTIKDANKCKELWDINNGITISRGEHRIITLLERIKNISPGFLQILKDYIEKNQRFSPNKK